MSRQRTETGSGARSVHGSPRTTSTPRSRCWEPCCSRATWWAPTAELGVTSPTSTSRPTNTCTRRSGCWRPAGQPVDAVTVADELRRAGLLEEIGGVSTLLELQNATPAISNAGRYAQIVQDTAMLRRLITVAGDLAETGVQRSRRRAQGARHRREQGLRTRRAAGHRLDRRDQRGALEGHGGPGDDLHPGRGDRRASPPVTPTSTSCSPDCTRRS